jgi:hypothetical protein
MARHFALLGNIRQGWKQLTVTNAPAYCIISIVFVTIRNSHPSLTFMSQAGLHSTAMYLALPRGIRLGWRQHTSLMHYLYSVCHYEELSP